MGTRPMHSNTESTESEERLGLVITTEHTEYTEFQFKPFLPRMTQMNADLWIFNTEHVESSEIEIALPSPLRTLR